MESKANYTVVGLFVLILSAGLLITGIWLSTGFDHKKYNKYVVYMSEPVSGLNEDSPIKFNGVKVGMIDSITLNQLDPQKVKLVIDIEEGTPISVSTQATLISQGITGNTYLGLSATSADYTPLEKTPGERYPVIPYKASFFNQLEKNIDELSAGAKRVFNKQNSANLSKMLANLKTTTDVIARNNEELNKSLHKLPQLIDEFAAGIQEFKGMAKEVASAGQQVKTTMQAGRNTIDKISQQAVPPTVILLRRLDVVAANLEKISTQMRENPSVILRGSAPPPKGPGE